MSFQKPEKEFGEGPVCIPTVTTRIERIATYEFCREIYRANA